MASGLATSTDVVMSHTGSKADPGKASTPSTLQCRRHSEQHGWEYAPVFQVILITVRSVTYVKCFLLNAQTTEIMSGLCYFDC